MIGFSEDVLRLVKIYGSNTKQAYVIQRWAELLDTNTPFYLSAFIRMLPEDALMELKDLFNIYLEKPDFALFHLMSSMRRVESILATDRVLQRESMNHAVKKLKDHISSFLLEFNQIKKDKNSEENSNIDRRNYIDGNLKDFLKYIEDAIEVIKINYKKEIFNLFKKYFMSKHVHYNEMKGLDYSVTMLATILVSQGRSPKWCIRDIVDKLKSDTYAGMNNVDEVILKTFENILYKKPGEYKVATVIGGINGIDENRLVPDIEGWVKVKPGRMAWSADSGVSSNQKLKEFYQMHVVKPKPRKRNTRSNNKIPQALVRIISIYAWDVDHARAQALEKTEKVADLLNVGNRNKSVGVKRKTLVYSVQYDRCFHRNDHRGSYGVLKPAYYGSHVNLSNTLRFASMVKNEHSTVSGILYAWISLESLFSGRKDTQKKVINVIPSLAARSAVRGVISNCRTLLDIECSGSINVSCRYKDKSLYEVYRFLVDNECKIIDFIKVYNLSLFSSYRLYSVFRIIKNTDTVQNYVAEKSSHVRWALERAAHLRNQTVHSAQTDATSGGSLLFACIEILDSVFEVIQYADNIDGPIDNFDITLQDYGKKFRELYSKWNEDSAKSLLSGALGEYDSSN